MAVRVLQVLDREIRRRGEGRRGEGGKEAASLTSLLSFLPSLLPFSLPPSITTSTAHLNPILSESILDPELCALKRWMGDVPKDGEGRSGGGRSRSGGLSGEETKEVSLLLAARYI